MGRSTFTLAFVLLAAGLVGPAAHAITTAESRVAASADDAEENESGSVSIVGSDLELGWDGNAQTLGMRFPLVHLRGLGDTERVEEDLGLLERRGLLDRDREGPVASCVFRHVLTHEVVLGSLLQADRQARHRRAAEMLERLYRGRTQEVADLVGHHWASSDARPRAFPYLLTAADGAVAVGANREAIGHLETALGLVTQGVAPIPDASLAGLKLKLAGLHFIVGER